MARIGIFKCTFCALLVISAGVWLFQPGNAAAAWIFGAAFCAAAVIGMVEHS